MPFILVKVFFVLSDSILLFENTVLTFFSYGKIIMHMNTNFLNIEINLITYAEGPSLGLHPQTPRGDASVGREGLAYI